MMPCFLPSLDITKDKQGNETMRAFNGIVTLSVDHIDEETDLEAVKRVAAMMPRRASFIATTNMTDILADPSGSRRFIGVELTAPIDVTTSINYDQLYAQAIDAIYKGERYWFDQQETEELIAHNRKYQMLSPAEQYFRLCFEVCQDPSEGEYLSAAAIFQRIKQVAGSSLGISAVTKFGQFLTNIDGIVRKRNNSGMVYLVRQIQRVNS